MPSDIQRKLTTILAADAAGYSRVMELNEEEGLRALKAARAVFKKFITRHYGRVANTAGDGLIAEFPSVVEAVQCAIEVQRELGDQQQDPEMALNFRIGIHLGDVMVDGEDLLGEGVNLAARLQSMAEPGGILLSQQVYDQVRGKLTVGFDYIGERHPKNFSEGVQVYCVSNMANAYPKMHIPEPERSSPEAAPQSAAPFAAKASSWPEDEFDEVFNKERPNASTSEPVPEDLEATIHARGKHFAVIFGALCLIDMISGYGIWAHWPGLALLTVWCLKAAPLWANDRFSPAMVRGAVLVMALVLINMFSWDGYFWSIWPTAAIGFVAFLRRPSNRA
ncbi:MAG: adenylate/guanylate cyclase domain-containing protein [Rhodobacteraceae bacterium]|nr:adenylate/guanylate cyclase domain-containing protein [Paracoccaceae bacterium]